jgi:hypothetical protein
VKIWMRATIFVAGVALIVFGFHQAHTHPATTLNADPSTTGGAGEMLVVIGLFIGLLAFAPSAQTLGRWMSTKRKHRAPPAQFRRRRKS